MTFLCYVKGDKKGKLHIINAQNSFARKAQLNIFLSIGIARLRCKKEWFHESWPLASILSPLTTNCFNANLHNRLLPCILGQSFKISDIIWRMKEYFSFLETKCTNRRFDLIYVDETNSYLKNMSTKNMCLFLKGQFWSMVHRCVAKSPWLQFLGFCLPLLFYSKSITWKDKRLPIL